MIALKIRLYQDSAGGLLAEFIDGLNSISQNNSGKNVVQVIVDGFELQTEEMLQIAYATSLNEADANTESVGFNFMERSYTDNSWIAQVDPIVLLRRGIWYLDLRAVTETDSEIDTVSHLEEKLQFAVNASLQDVNGKHPNKGDIAALYQTALNAVAESATTAENVATNITNELVPRLVEKETEILKETVQTNTDNIAQIRQEIINEAHFRGYVLTNAIVKALQGNENDYAYSAESGTKWIYQNGTWVNSGIKVPDQITPASDTTPLMDGAASSGQANAYARGDHRHPTDTTRLAASEKGQANGVATLNEKGQVPQGQLSTIYTIINIANLVIEELREENDNQSQDILKNTNNIENLKVKTELHSQVIQKSGLMYSADNTASWNERITADGLNVLDGSKAVLKKVVGSTVACKQLFIPENVVEYGQSTVFDETENAYLIPSAGLYYYNSNKYLYEYQGKENTQYTFTVEIKQGTAVNIGFVFHYSDGTTSNVSNRIKPTNYTLYSATSEAGKTLTAISLNYQTNGSMYFKNARLNEGTADFGYQPYFTGLKSASFGGIESTNEDGTETSTLVFPLTETPEGTTIDFVQKAVVVNGVSTPFTSAQLANLTFATDSNGNNLGAVYTIYNGGNESVQGNSNAEYLANNELTINYVYITEVQ